MDLLAVVLSVCAFGFTIYSFWWMNWRSGDLLVGAPRTYVISSKSNRLSLKFPLSIYNTGPKPILVQNLRISIHPAEQEFNPLFFNSTASELEKTNENNVLATQFVVDGNSATDKIYEFRKRGDNLGFGDTGTYTVKLEAKLNESRWSLIKEFSLHINLACTVAITSGQVYIGENDL